MNKLRHGEILLENCAGGPCAVCKGKIPPGRAVQLSKWTSRIRHEDCMPKTDEREGVGGKEKKYVKFYR